MWRHDQMTWPAMDSKLSEDMRNWLSRGYVELFVPIRRLYLSDIWKKIEDSTSDYIHVRGLNMFPYRLDSLTPLYASHKVANYKANDQDRTNICLNVRARDQLTEYEWYSFCSHFTETVNITVFLFPSIHTTIPSSLSSLAPPLSLLNLLHFTLSFRLCL